MANAKITFHRKLFTKIYWHIIDAFSNLKIRFIWCYGGSSASKTFSVVQAIVIDMMTYKNSNSLVLRKFHVDIRDSIYSDFKNIITLFESNDEFIIQQDFIKNKITGSFVRFRGLDDSEKVKGIAGFKRIILEEVSQFEKEDFKQIRKRLRGQLGQQIIGIFNPISEDHWIKTDIFDTDIFIELISDISEKKINAKGNTLILKTNYLDNEYIVGKWKDEKLIGGFVDQHAIEDFEKDKETDYEYYRIYGLGDWGKLRVGGEFWKDFNTNYHVKKNDIKNSYPELYRKDLPIHMTWDENVNPYLPCALWQTETVEGKKRAWQIDEIAGVDPKNNIRCVTDEFKHRYPVNDVCGLFITGDRTSVKEDTKKEKGENFFTDIVKALEDYSPRLRLPTSNPSVLDSKNFVNACYARNFENIFIEIGSNCKKSIHDYSYTLEDRNGLVDKSLKKNPVTKVSFQEFGHFSDSKRYLLTMLFPNEYGRYRTRNNSVGIVMGKTEHSQSW